jgi:hypothetical protein
MRAHRQGWKRERGPRGTHSEPHRGSMVVYLPGDVAEVAVEVELEVREGKRRVV